MRSRKAEEIGARNLCHHHSNAEGRWWLHGPMAHPHPDQCVIGNAEQSPRDCTRHHHGSRKDYQALCPQGQLQIISMLRLIVEVRDLEDSTSLYCWYRPQNSLWYSRPRLPLEYPAKPQSATHLRHHVTPTEKQSWVVMDRSEVLVKFWMRLPLTSILQTEMFGLFCAHHVVAGILMDQWRSLTLCSAVLWWQRWSLCRT